MDEREKIIDIIQSVKYCDTNNRCDECKYDKELEKYKDMSCGSLKAADALIAANIGDVTEWKERAEKHRVIALPGGRIKQLYSDEEVERIAKERDEYKHRAEVAERALMYAIGEYRCDECPCMECNAEIRGSQECVELICAEYKKQAEREIEEEKWERDL